MQIKIPATTRVEEWTSDLTGVGAAIAIGNHLWKGICALFAKIANKIIIQNHGENLKSLISHTI